MKKLLSIILLSIPLFAFDFSDIIEETSKATVSILAPMEPASSSCWPCYRYTSIGTGFFISPSGYIVTNNHVVAGAKEIFVILAQGSTVTASCVAQDPLADVALLKVEGEDFPFLKWGDAEQVRPGDPVLAIGNPKLNDYICHASWSSGIISAKNRYFCCGDRRIIDFIQVDATSGEGFSGGPLLNQNGEVIGLNTLGPMKYYCSFGFATSSQIVQRVVKKMVANGTVQYGHLGCVLEGPDSTLHPNLSSKAILKKIAPHSPAERAGLQEGDKVIAFDNTPIHTSQGLTNEILLSVPEATHTLTIQRQEETLEIEVTLEEAKCRQKTT